MSAAGTVRWLQSAPATVPPVSSAAIPTRAWSPGRGTGRCAAIFVLPSRSPGPRLCRFRTAASYVGCGDGTLAAVCARNGAARIFGCDPDPRMVTRARDRAMRGNFRIALAVARSQALPFPDSSFDVVTCITVLAFVADANNAIREMARVLRPGGRLVIGDLSNWSLWAVRRRIRGWFGAKLWRQARFRIRDEACGNDQAGGPDCWIDRGFDLLSALDDTRPRRRHSIRGWAKSRRWAPHLWQSRRRNLTALELADLPASCRLPAGGWQSPRGGDHSTADRHVLQCRNGSPMPRSLGMRARHVCDIQARKRR